MPRIDVNITGQPPEIPLRSEITPSIHDIPVDDNPPAEDGPETGEDT